MDNGIIFDAGGCLVEKQGDEISCRYPSGGFERKWKIRLLPDRIIYTDKSKEEQAVFISRIKEFQYEVDGRDGRNGVSAFTSAYIILKDDDDPKQLFSLLVHENFVLNNQTQAYAICTQILNYIGEYYSIPVAYKLSIDTKQKQNNIGWAILALVLAFVIIYLRLSFDQH